MESSERRGTIQASGADLYYELHGEGEPVVLLHGGLGSGRNWGYFPGLRSAGFHLVIPDLRGHGRSTNPLGILEHRQCALDVFALLDSLGIDKFKGVGVSLGGNTLLHMATQQPDRVRAMVLASATTHFPEQARVLMREFTVESRTGEEWRRMREEHVHGDEQIRALWRQARAFKDSYDDMSFTPPTLARITARTLIVAGDRDPFYPLEIPLALYRAIPASSLWVLPGGGHGAIFDEQVRSFFADTASRFLRSLP